MGPRPARRPGERWRPTPRLPARRARGAMGSPAEPARASEGAAGGGGGGARGGRRGGRGGGGGGGGGGRGARGPGARGGWGGVTPEPAIPGRRRTYGHRITRQLGLRLLTHIVFLGFRRQAREAEPAPSR